MRILVVTFAILFFTLPAVAQVERDTLAQQITELTSEVATLRSQLTGVQSQNTRLSAQLDSIEARLTGFDEAHQAFRDELNAGNERVDGLEQKLTDTGQKVLTSSERISTLDSTLDRNTLYWILAVLTVALLALGIFFILRRRIAREKEDLARHINEETVKLDEKLVEVLDKQLEVLSRSAQAAPTEEEIDHSLALKVADEIVRIETNLSRMDEGTRGLKQLSSSVRRIKDNFQANGYEMVDMLNKEYHEGINAIVSFKLDESLVADEKIITRVIKPQVNFRGVMIQAAQIEVTQGE